MNTQQKETREFLNRAWDAELDIRRKRTQINRLRTLAERVTANYGGIPGGGGVSDKCAEAVAEIDDVERAMAADVIRLAKCIAEINAVIDKVEDPIARTVLDMRYLRHYSWNRIMAETGFSDWVYKLHRNSLNEVYKLVSKNQ